MLQTQDTDVENRANIVDNAVLVYANTNDGYGDSQNNEKKKQIIGWSFCHKGTHLLEEMVSIGCILIQLVPQYLDMDYGCPNS